MALSTAAAGKTYDPVTYAIGREGVKDYALAVGERDPLHLDVEAARSAGHADVVAPPMFAAVYSAPALGAAIFDPEVGMDFALMVHAAQAFVWGPLVIAGDEVTTTVTVKSIDQVDDMGWYVFESQSSNQAGQTVYRGTWTNLVRAV